MAIEKNASRDDKYINKEYNWEILISKSFLFICFYIEEIRCRVWMEWDCLLLCRSLSLTHIYLFVILFKVELMQVTLSIVIIVIIVIRMINNLTRLKTKKQQQWKREREREIRYFKKQYLEVRERKNIIFWISFLSCRALKAIKIKYCVLGFLIFFFKFSVFFVEILALYYNSIVRFIEFWEVFSSSSSSNFVVYNVWLQAVN